MRGRGRAQLPRGHMLVAKYSFSRNAIAIRQSLVVIMFKYL